MTIYEQMPLGRRVPADWKHVERYRLTAVEPGVVAAVEDVIAIPQGRLRRLYDQGSEGACVGFAWSWALSILNTAAAPDGRRTVPYYDARWLYQSAQAVDEWGDTPPESGTSVRAAADVLRDRGPVRFYRGRTIGPVWNDGISVNRWATSVDEIRSAIALGMPAVIGVNWYENFDRPAYLNGAYWIGTDGVERRATSDLGRIRGGHAVCVYGASDRRQAVKIVNNWGMLYPLVWMPYAVLSRLLDELGEASVITDR